MNVDSGTTPAVTGSMGPEQSFDELRKRFFDLLKTEGVLGKRVIINTRSLTPEEAIGITKRGDSPIITGKDVMVQTECMGALEQAFTGALSAFHGTLAGICELDIQGSSYDRGPFIASLNAVMGHLGKVEYTVHYRDSRPEQCTVGAAGLIEANYGHPRVGLIGYQPSLLERLSDQFPVRVVDLSPISIGQQRYGILVEDGRMGDVSTAVYDWADLVLCTNSTVCNGGVVNFLHSKGKILFYGTTLAGAAALVGLPRTCFAGRY